MAELEYNARMNAVVELQRDIHADITVIPVLHHREQWGWRVNIEGIDPIMLSSANQDWQKVRNTE